MDRILSILKFNVRSLLPKTSMTFQVLLFLIFLTSLLVFSHIAGATQEHELIRNIGLVIAALIGFPMLIWRTSIADRQASTAEASHVAETYTKAIEQLGAVNDEGYPKLELRLGALYSLEKIALSNEDYHPQVMEVLCAYVRLNARLNSLEHEKESMSVKAVDSPREDIQTAITIVGRRNVTFDPERASLNLSSVDLEGADFSNAQLNNVNFDGSHLANTKFINASIQHCSFVKVELGSSNLSLCNAVSSDFSSSSLIDSTLYGADISDSTLENTKLQSARLDQTRALRIKARSSDFSHAYIRDTDFSGSSLASGNFSDADAFSCQFIDVDINRANFSEANLNCSVFKNAKAHKAKFPEAELYTTAFEDMNFYGCDISAEDLFHSKLSNVGPEELINEVENLRKASAEAST